MNNQLSISRSFTVCAALLMLPACSSGSSAPLLGASGVTQPNAGQRANGLPLALNGRSGARDTRSSWMSADAKRVALLYVSDEDTSDVYVYSISTDRLVGVLTGFNGPRGICANKNHDIWITESGNSKLLEYAHGGTHPIHVLYDPGQYPVACSVESASGELAATNIISAKDGPGSLSLYANANGLPTLVPAFSQTYIDGYDPDGNLFVNGWNNVGWSQFGEIVRGQDTVTKLTIAGGAIGNAGGIQYADGSLALGDYQGISGHAAIYQVTVNGTTATITGTTELLHSRAVVAFFILGDQVFCLNDDDGPEHVEKDVTIYKYPAGGEPIKIIHNPAFSIPVGVAVSM